MRTKEAGKSARTQKKAYQSPSVVRRGSFVEMTQTTTNNIFFQDTEYPSVTVS